MKYREIDIKIVSIDADRTVGLKLQIIVSYPAMVESIGK